MAYKFILFIGFLAGATGLGGLLIWQTVHAFPWYLILLLCYGIGTLGGVVAHELWRD